MIIYFVLLIFPCVVSMLQYRMVDPAHGALDDSYTPEDDSHEAHSVFSEEGTTRRADNGVAWEFIFPSVISVSSDSTVKKIKIK